MRIDRVRGIELSSYVWCAPPATGPVQTHASPSQRGRLSRALRGHARSTLMRFDWPPHRTKVRCSIARRRVAGTVASRDAVRAGLSSLNLPRPHTGSFSLTSAVSTCPVCGILPLGFRRKFALQQKSRTGVRRKFNVSRQSWCPRMAGQVARGCRNGGWKAAYAGLAPRGRMLDCLSTASSVVRVTQRECPRRASSLSRGHRLSS